MPGLGTSWDDDVKAALDKHLEVSAALQREFVDALLRVAEKYDYDPVELAMNAGNSMHTLFQPLSRIQQQRYMQQQQAMQPGRQDPPQAS
jgi:hypothetical protein